VLTRVNPPSLGPPKPDQTGRNQPTASIRHPSFRNPRSPLRIQITGRNRTECGKSTTYAGSQSNPALSTIPHSALRIPHWNDCIERGNPVTRLHCCPSTT